MYDNSVISLPVKSGAGAISAYRRVGIDSNGECILEGADTDFLGTLLQDVDGTVASDGSYGRNIADIQLKGCGVHYATAGGAISVGDEIDAAANGKVVTTAANPIGRALEAAAKDGDIIRVFYYNQT